MLGVTTPAASSRQSGAGFTPLVAIQQGRSKLPFFCVHGAGGNVLNLRDIARRLGPEQTFYGLQARGVDGAEPLTTIEEMAELYSAEVTRVQPHGPYLLGGYSGGGLVAFEMAQRLLAAGETIGHLALLDTFAAGTAPMPPTFAERFDELKTEGTSYLRWAVRKRFKDYTTAVQNRLKVRFYASHGQPLPLELVEYKLMQAFLEASAKYRPKPYPGPVTLYRAGNIHASFRHVGPKLGWDEVAPAMEVCVIPGDHDSLVYDPNVDIMISHLKRALRAAESTARA